MYNCSTNEKIKFKQEENQFLMTIKKKLNEMLSTRQKSQIFQDIDTRLLSGIECNGSTANKNRYLEQLKIQTSLAMENKRYKVITKR